MLRPKPIHGYAIKDPEGRVNPYTFHEHRDAVWCGLTLGDDDEQRRLVRNGYRRVRVRLVEESDAE